MGEYRIVLLRPKFSFHPAQIDALPEQIHATGEVVATTTPLEIRLPHPTDEPFVEVALAATADYLVTGNRKHYPANARRGIKAVSPADFIAAL